MDDMFEFGTEQFVRYEKEHGVKPTRNQKKEKKLEKLRKDLKDPEQRRLRHKLRREQEKAKLQKELEGMNEE